MEEEERGLERKNGCHEDEHGPRNLGRDVAQCVCIPAGEELVLSFAKNGWSGASGGGEWWRGVVSLHVAAPQGHSGVSKLSFQERSSVPATGISSWERVSPAPFCLCAGEGS